MATIVPRQLPASATRSEGALYRLLAQLPDDCVVYFEPMVDGRHPDFVVIVPSLGVLVIEVKGWYAAKLKRLDAESIDLVRKGNSGQVQRVKTPEKQVRDYVFRLRDIARAHRWSASLLHADGPYKGELRFPFAPLVALPNISRNSLEENGVSLDDWDSIFPPTRTLLKGDLRSLEPLHGEALVGALKEHVVPWWPFAPFDVATTNVLRAVIHPEIELENAVSIGHLETRPRDIHDQQDVIQVLDTNQEDHAQALGDGHRIVYGVAGSGKTILLLARAKRLVELGRKRILLVCYNRMLAAWLKRELHASPEVSVMTFHQWAGRMGIPFDPGMDDAALGVALLKQVSEHPTSASMYEAVLIDEAQDFEPDWFRCLLTAMEDPENGDLLIVADGCQSLYRRSKISWKSLGIKARGRTISSGYQLHQNYRNASEVIALAESFAFRSTDEDDLDAIQSVRVDLSRCQRSSGASPLLLECDDRRSELNQAFQIARDLLKGRWRGCPVGAFQPGEIAMLYPNAPGHAERELLEEFAGWMACKGIPCSWLSRNSWARDDAANDRLKIQTIHSAKGLQYLAVIILWADKLPRCSESRLSDRRLLYVGMTRAISLLAITASRRSAFVDEVASCPAVDVHRCSQYAASVIQSNSASNPAGEADPSPALVI